MNKHLFYTLGIAATVFMASCSSDEDIVSSDSEPVVIGDSEVPIQFGNNPTRSAVYSDTDGNFETDSIGVFALATGYLSETAKTSYPIYWSRYNYNSTSKDGYSVLLNNVYASAKKVTTTENGATTTTTAIQWPDGKNYYYPLGDLHSYSFAAYHPLQPDSMISFLTGQCLVQYDDLDGTQDIIAATCCDSTSEYAYSAKYFRTNTDAAKPHLDFKHMLIKFTFSMEPYLVNGEPESGVANTGIAKIEMLDMPKEANLFLYPTHEPYIEFTSYPGGGARQDYVLRGENDTEMDTCYISSNGVIAKESDGTFDVKKYTHTLGQGMFVPYNTSLNNTYKVRVTVVKKGSNWSQTYTMSLPYDESMPWKAGSTYNISFKMHAARDIEITAKLTEWETGGTIEQEL